MYLSFDVVQLNYQRSPAQLPFAGRYGTAQCFLVVVHFHDLLLLGTERVSLSMQEKGCQQTILAVLPTRIFDISYAVQTASRRL